MTSTTSRPRIQKSDAEWRRTGRRYCMNGTALTFAPQSDAAEK
jgi:peptide methionine sulfoxide reductase MsrB